MKNCKRFLACLLCAVMLISVLPVVSVFATEYKTGDIIQFGSYPQSEVKNEYLIAKLKAASGTWKSYGYMSGAGTSWADGSAQPSNYMQYKDVTVDGNKYRAVIFSTYRKIFTNYISDGSMLYNEQGYNCYYINTTYWFKFEPLNWRILDPQTGLVLCEDIIDSQPYSNTIYEYYDSTDADGDGNTTSYWKDAEHKIYANNYAESSIRAWLNDDFYNTAFSDSEQGNIARTTIDTKSDSPFCSIFDSATTDDKVFLLTYDDAINPNYGFSAHYNAYDINRRVAGSDYAICQGLSKSSVLSSYPTADGQLSSRWWLRTARGSSRDAAIVGDYGYIGNYEVHCTYNGVRPAMILSSIASTKPTEPSTEPPTIPLTDDPTTETTTEPSTEPTTAPTTEPTTSPSTDNNTKKPTVGEKIKAFFQRIIDWFRNLFKR